MFNYCFFQSCFFGETPKHNNVMADKGLNLFDECNTVKIERHLEQFLLKRQLYFLSCADDMLVACRSIQKDFSIFTFISLKLFLKSLCPSYTVQVFRKINMFKAKSDYQRGTNLLANLYFLSKYILTFDILRHLNKVSVESIQKLFKR